MTSNNLDPYSAQAKNAGSDNTPQDKISGLHQIVKSAKMGMLTTRDVDGHLHARAMIPCSPSSESQLTLVFIANNSSHKFNEIKNDDNVNVSFYDSETNWASYSGKAKISQDQELIKKHWSMSVSAYFGDLKDGIHKGDEHDPRVSVIQVIPDEIRYWVATKGAITRAVDQTVNAMRNTTSVPGELRTITKSEILLSQGLQTK